MLIEKAKEYESNKKLKQEQKLIKDLEECSFQPKLITFADKENNEADTHLSL